MTTDDRVPEAQVPEITAEALAGRIGTETAPILLDVREPGEFEAWAIPGARNLPLDQLASNLEEVGSDRDVVVVCASGARSARAVTMLRSAGVDALNLAGGMLAWAGVYDTAELDVAPARIVQVRRRGKGCLSYLVGAGDEAFVIDPSLDIEQYLREADDRGWRITRVFDTHLHADHLSGARSLARATGASLHLNPADPFDFDYEPLTDGQWFDLGGQPLFGVTAFATPGHTRGSTVFEIGGRALVTGDTLFIDGVGRPDLADHAEAFARELHRSLHTKVITLPAEVVVLPAHHSEAVVVPPDGVVGAQLGELRERVSQLAWPEDEFVDWAANRATPRPPHYHEIIRINMSADSEPEAWRRLELGPNRCAA